MRLATFQSEWDWTSGPVWRCWGHTDPDRWPPCVCAPGDDEPWQNTPRLPKAKKRWFTRGVDDYAARRCVNCKHLRYSGEVLGDPCWFCQCSRHVLPDERNIPYRSRWDVKLTGGGMTHDAAPLPSSSPGEAEPLFLLFPHQIPRHRHRFKKRGVVLGDVEPAR